MAKGWQHVAAADFMDERNIQRRVQGPSDIRFDGFGDLLMRARGASVIDIGCNRGHIAWDFFVNGARQVHGCDIHAPSIQVARIWFSEIPGVESKFEVVDLTQPGAMTKAFGDSIYDIVLFIGVYHKLSRVMEAGLLSELVTNLGRRAKHYFAWNGYPTALKAIDAALDVADLYRVQTGELAHPGHAAAIWKRR